MTIRVMPLFIYLLFFLEGKLTLSKSDKHSASDNFAIIKPQSNWRDNETCSLHNHSVILPWPITVF